MSLAALQQDFRAWLHVGRLPPDIRFSGAAAGLEIYQNNFRGQIETCLEESFPVTRAWLGDDDFRTAVVAHVAETPPTSWSLDHYPDQFPAALAKLYPDDPEVAELAILELALSHAFVAADAVPVTAADLADVNWDVALIVLSPSFRSLPLTTNAPAIWSAINTEGAPPALSVLPVASELLVWRCQESPRFRTTDKSEGDALRQVRDGTNFGALCAGLAGAGGDDPASVAGGWLARWLSDGLIVKIEGDAPCTS